MIVPWHTLPLNTAGSPSSPSENAPGTEEGTDVGVEVEKPLAISDKNLVL
jgi:hypothetical protein